MCLPFHHLLPFLIFMSYCIGLLGLSRTLNSAAISGILVLLLIFIRKILEAEHIGFQPNSHVPLPCPLLPRADVGKSWSLMQTCGSIPFSCFWLRHGHVTSSGQWGVRSLLGASGKGFLAPIDTQGGDSPLSTSGCCVWIFAWSCGSHLETMRDAIEDDSEKDRRNLSPRCHQWAVEL